MKKIMSQKLRNWNWKQQKGNKEQKDYKKRFGFQRIKFNNKIVKVETGNQK